jgi:hypothetical protein
LAINVAWLNAVVLVGLFALAQLQGWMGRDRPSRSYRLIRQPDFVILGVAARRGAATA